MFLYLKLLGASPYTPNTLFTAASGSWPWFTLDCLSIFICLTTLLEITQPWCSFLPSFVAQGSNSTPFTRNTFVFLLLDWLFESHFNTILLVKLYLQGELPNRQEARQCPRHYLIHHTFNCLRLFCLSVILRKVLCSPSWPGTLSLVSPGMPQTLLSASKMLQTYECAIIPELFI